MALPYPATPQSACTADAVQPCKSRGESDMKDDEIEDLLLRWAKAAVAVAVLCVIAAIGFVVGYLL